MKLNEVKQRRDKVLNEGRAAVGAWSSYGVADLRTAFWKAWEEGKEAARRMTMMDAVFIGLGSMTGSSNNNNDNSFLILLVRVLFQFLANLTIGLLTSLVIFVMEAYYIISSYGPSFMSGLSLFLLVVITASSVIATAVGGIVGGACGGVYLLIRNAEKRALEEAAEAEESYRPQLRPHYD